MAKAKGKAKAKGAKRKSDVVGKEEKEVHPRPSVANFIRSELTAGTETAKIVEKAAKKFPDKKPTAGYVNWVREHAPKVSTTTASAVV